LLRGGVLLQANAYRRTPKQIEQKVTFIERRLFVFKEISKQQTSL
jgi:hypothetical protein